MGTGPYKVKDFDFNVGGTMDRNPDYFDKDRVYLDAVKRAFGNRLGGLALPTMRLALASDSSDHEVRHGGRDQALAGVRQLLIVLAQTPVATQPAQGAFHDPAMRFDLKAGGPLAAGDHLQDDPEVEQHPVHQAPALSAAGPDALQTGQFGLDFAQHQLGSVSVLNVSPLHHGGPHQTQRIHQEVAFAPLYLLAGVIATDPPFSVVFTDGLSRMAAEGVGSLPSRTRSLVRTMA